MTTKAFASQADLTDKQIKFEQLSAHCWAYTAEGDPNSGVIIGDKYILVSDATATPDMARDLIKKIRSVSDKPIKYVLLTHPLPRSSRFRRKCLCGRRRYRNHRQPRHAQPDRGARGARYAK